MKPYERTLVFLNRFSNGWILDELAISDKAIKGSLKDFEKLQELFYSKNFRNQTWSNFDLVWLARMTNATGMLFPHKTNLLSDENIDGCYGNGCEFLLPLYIHVHDIAMAWFINKNTKTKEDFEKFSKDSKKSLEEFKTLWMLNPQELSNIELTPEKLAFHQEVANIMLNPDGSSKPMVAIKDSTSGKTFWDDVQKRMGDVYKHTKQSIIRSHPFKSKKLDKEELWDVDFWDSNKNQTALRKGSVDKLLSELGYSFTLEDFKKQFSKGNDPIGDEIKEKRIIQSIGIIQHQQKGISRDAYYKQIQRISQMTTLFKFGFIYLERFKHKDINKDELWATEDSPKICKIHCTPSIIQLTPIVSDTMLHMFPDIKLGEATSLRNCLKYYKMIIDKFDIPQPTQEEVDKMIDVADADLDNFVASRTQV